MSIPTALISFLEDPKVTDLCFNGFDDFYFDRGEGLEKTAAAVFSSDTEFRNFVLEQLSISGKTWDAKLPFVDAVFFHTHRAHIAFPPLSQNGILLSLRRLPSSQGSDESVNREKSRARWAGSSREFEYLVQAIGRSDTILFAGGTGSGKTTLLNDLIPFIPPAERLLVLEDTAEIQKIHPHLVRMLTRTANPDGFGAVTLRDLFRQTLRMRPDRILIGECRGDEVIDFLQALNSGHRGFMGTLHANSARDAIRRLELLALLAAKGTIPLNLIQELIANGVQTLVYLERTNGEKGENPRGARKITSILKIEGRERDVILARPAFAQSPPSLHTGIPTHALPR